MRVIVLLLAMLAQAGCATVDRAWEASYMARLSAAAAAPREPHLQAARVAPIGYVAQDGAAVTLSERWRNSRFACHDGATLALYRAADGRAATAAWNGAEQTFSMRRADRDGALVYASDHGELELAGESARWRSGQERTVVVAARDTLSRISERAYGTPAHVQRIVDANPDVIVDPDRIEIGQMLRLPGGGDAQTRRCRRVG
ncbi:MAG: hypothetical protein GC206_09720 [Alphaproteobacteria bacterium]|nr:hypothetical protein [Alphaproteobacteria bacterium]